MLTGRGLGIREKCGLFGTGSMKGHQNTDAVSQRCGQVTPSARAGEQRGRRAGRSPRYPVTPKSPLVSSGLFGGARGRDSATHRVSFPQIALPVAAARIVSPSNRPPGGAGPAPAAEARMAAAPPPGKEWGRDAAVTRALAARGLCPPMRGHPRVPGWGPAAGGARGPARGLSAQGAPNCPRLKPVCAHVCGHLCTAMPWLVGVCIHIRAIRVHTTIHVTQNLSAHMHVYMTAHACVCAYVCV